MNAHDLEKVISNLEGEIETIYEDIEQQEHRMDLLIDTLLKHKEDLENRK